MAVSTKALDCSYSRHNKVAQAARKFIINRTELIGNDRKEIDEALSNIQVQGACYSDGAQKKIDR